MKQTVTTLIAIIALTLFSKCTKSSSGSSTTSTTLNTTETQLIGTWQEVSSRDSTATRDTTYTGYNNTYYAEFVSDIYPGAPGSNSWKKCTTSFIEGPASTNGGNIAGYWYYDNTTKLLTLNTLQMSIVTLTSSQLVLRLSVGSETVIYTFSK